MSAIIPSSDQFPTQLVINTPPPSLPQQAADGMISMSKTYALVHCIDYALTKHTPDQRAGYSLMAALSIPTKAATTFGFTKLLGCREDTPVRNFTREIASMLSSTYISALASEKIGFDISAADMLSQNAAVVGYALGTGLLVGATGLAIIIGLNRFFPQVEEVEMDEEDEFEHTLSVPLNRVSQYQLTSPAKTEQAKQRVFANQ